MTIAAYTWPDALVWSVAIAALGLVLAVLIWSIFRTGQTAIRSERRQHEELQSLRAEVDDVRAHLQQSTPPTDRGRHDQTTR
jgi:Flp pilus assembly protein TadB